ncbi:hypothetical protein GCM10010329_45790 [Streptomyces spiroverticillatus]|uniref:Tetratricopeptide repeat protein n=1 Tax=Streptomyces finlayi TaxID=67296 RepID=A0A919CB81_9ACTN|nr:tetratricopeptide repeat protein [Streptomyces finlayi]GHA17561.1 hypothetical protein GCM10010329_45790 [Streptomyces spiroverticillatus]GHC99429.1 hypothetical protein GCM10010334_42960 [Streptomyces finlayi]
MRRPVRAALGASASTLVVLACATGLLALGPTESPALPDHAPTASLAHSQRALKSIELARSTLDESHLATAERALARSLALQPRDNYTAVVGSGMLAGARHDFAASRAHALKATAMAPDRAPGYAVLADAETQLGHRAAATAAVQRLLDLAPTSSAYARAAQELESQGRTDEARAALERASEIALNPADASFAALRLGDLDLETGHPDRAVRHYDRSLAVAPGNAYAVAGKARAKAALGRTQEALRLYRKVTERTPAPRFLYELGSLQKKLGQDPRTAFAALDAQSRLALAQGGAVDPCLGLYQANHRDPHLGVRLLRAEWQRRQHSSVADALSWALHRAGRSEEALEYARRATAGGRRSADALQHLGAIETSLQLPSAAHHLRQSRTLNPYLAPEESAR